MESHLEKACYLYTFTYVFLFYIRSKEMAYWPPLMEGPQSCINFCLVLISPLCISQIYLFFISYSSSLFTSLYLSHFLYTFVSLIFVPSIPPSIPPSLPPPFTHVSPVLLPFFFLSLCFPHFHPLAPCYDIITLVNILTGFLIRLQKHAVHLLKMAKFSSHQWGEYTIDF